MKVTYDAKRKVLIIEAPIAEIPTPSASGKTLVVASTRGNLKTGVKIPVDGGEKEVTLGLNAYVPKA